MSATFETLFGLQFCQHKCGTYIGFSDDEMSSDGKFCITKHENTGAHPDSEITIKGIEYTNPTYENGQLFLNNEKTLFLEMIDFNI